MQVKWTRAALTDLKRLYDFLARHNPTAASAMLHRMRSTPIMLQTHPKIGSPLHEFDTKDVRKLIVDDYELRYELTYHVIYILRIWHV